MSKDEKNIVNGEDRIILARLEERMKHIQNDLDDIKTNMVTKSEFNPIKTLVYGLIGLLLTGVVTALLNLVLG